MFQIQQINSMKISINIKRQAMKLLRKVSIQQATINDKPLIHSNQYQISEEEETNTSGPEDDNDNNNSNRSTTNTE